MLLKGTIKIVDFKGNYGEIVSDDGSDNRYFFHPIELKERGYTAKKYDKVTFEKDTLYKSTLVALNVTKKAA